jgi:beta-N-acetylhexosaminidase
MIIFVAIILLFIIDHKPKSNRCDIDNVKNISKYNCKVMDSESISEGESKDAEAIIECKIKELTLEQKIGQMIMGTYWRGDIQTAVSLIQHLYLGGILLFGYNIEDREETRRLIDLFQNTSISIKGIKLLVAIDQEGGRVSRLKKLLDHNYPPPQWYGIHHDTSGIRNQAHEVTELCSNIGINMNLAPVMDVLSNPNNVKADRSFGTNVNLVSELGCTYIKELQANGIIASAKHFPGIGSISIDTHDGLPIINIDSTGFNYQLIPFQNAINIGVETIMISHLVYPLLDSLPASLSKTAIYYLLREKLSFKGVIISDDMRMGAIIKKFPWETAIVLAVNAGIDILIIIGTRDELLTTRKVLVDAVRNKEIAENRIDEAVRRILQLKYRYQLL